MRFTGKRPQSFYKAKLIEGMAKASRVEKAKVQVAQAVQRAITLGKLMQL